MGNRTGSALGTGRRQHVVRPGICTLFRISCGAQFIFQQQVLTVAGAPWLRGAGQRALADTPPPASTAGYLQPQRHSLGTACWRLTQPAAQAWAGPRTPGQDDARPHSRAGVSDKSRTPQYSGLIRVSASLTLLERRTSYSQDTICCNVATGWRFEIGSFQDFES